MYLYAESVKILQITTVYRNHRFLMCFLCFCCWTLCPFYYHRVFIRLVLCV